MVFAPFPALFSCAAQMQNSLPYLEIAALVFLLNVVIVCMYLFIALLALCRLLEIKTTALHFDVKFFLNFF